MTPDRAPTLRRTVPVAPDADFDVLRAAALALIQRSQETNAAPWTDHNLHDPGITLLEAGLFAIADLHYRVAVRGIEAWGAEARDWRGGSLPFGVGRRQALQRVLAATGDDATAESAREAAERLVRSATSLDDAAVRIAAEVPDPGGGPLALAVARAIARVLREPALRRTALDQSGPIDAAVAEAASSAEALAAVAAALRDVDVWPEEIEALVARARQRRVARLLRDRADDLRRIVETAQDAGTALADLRGPFVEPEGTMLGLDDPDDTLVALALHPCPPVAPEIWEDARGETALWPPHALQARTVEPVTPADYRRLALAAPEVKRAFVVRGRAAGIDWKGAATNAPRPFRRGAFTIVVERAGLEPPRWDTTLTAAHRAWLRATLKATLGAETGRSDPDVPFPDFRAAADEGELDGQAPRRLLGDEVGAALVRSFGVVVKASVEVEPSGSLTAVRDDARALLRGFLSSDRASPLEPVPEPPAPLRCPDDLDGPWPAAAGVAAVRADPAGIAAQRGWPPGTPVRASEVAQLLQSITGVSGITGLALRREDQDEGAWSQTLAAPAGHEPYCIPAFAESPDCLLVRLRPEEACPGA